MSDETHDRDAARLLYASSHQGVLSTLSARLDGAPFGSVVTFAPDAEGAPVILISDIAEHTRNLRADPRVSLIVLEGGADVQEAGRLTIVGEARPTDDAGVAERYYRRFPHATDYHRTHDFAFYRITPTRLRYIGGFGRIHWYQPGDVLTGAEFAPEAEAHMVRHMNEDHVDAMRDYCRMIGVDCGEQDPRMAAVDTHGFALFVGKRMLRFEFDAPATTPTDVRKALVAMAQQARASA